MGKYTAFDTLFFNKNNLGGLLGPPPEDLGFDCDHIKIRTLLFPDQIKREKGVWWMPRQ